MMKYIKLIIIMCLSIGCGFTPEKISMGKYYLKNGDLIELEYVGYGATTPDVIWINRTIKDQKVCIGKIEAPSTFKTNVVQLDDTHVKIQLIDTSTFRGGISSYLVNVNDRIYPNDGSPYAPRIK